MENFAQSMMMPVCTFLEQGEALPDNLRTIFYTSDTTNLFTVLSTDSSENFALSYDVTYVTKHTDPIETETLKAAVDFSQRANAICFRILYAICQYI